MTYRLTGNYVGSCNCKEVCPCSCNGLPTAAEGKCHVALVFGLDQGNLDDTNLTGAHFALYFDIRARVGDGGWKAGMVVDEGASAEQVAGLERIITGKEGGPFGDLAGLIGEYLGTKQAAITISNGDSPKASVGGMTEVEFEGYSGPDGSPTTVKNAMFGFAPEFKIGVGKGQSSAFGLDFQSEYGEAAAFEFVG